jgi:hypothetical protein
MSRHIRRRGHYGSSQVYSIGDMAGILDGSVKGSDALVGVLLALAGYAGVNFAANQLSAVSSTGAAGMLPAPTSDSSSGLPSNSTAWLKATAPLLGGVAVGGAAFFLQKKQGSGPGHLLGAVAAGLAMTALKLLASASATSSYFSDFVSYQGDFGLLMRDPSMGLIMQDNGQLGGEEMYQIEGHLSDLAAASMGLDAEDAADALASFG